MNSLTRFLMKLSLVIERLSSNLGKLKRGRKGVGQTTNPPKEHEVTKEKKEEGGKRTKDLRLRRVPSTPFL